MWVSKFASTTSEGELLGVWGYHPQRVSSRFLPPTLISGKLQSTVTGGEGWYSIKGKLPSAEMLAFGGHRLGGFT